MSRSPRGLTPSVAALAVGSVLWALQCPDDEPAETPRTLPGIQPRSPNLDSLPAGFGCQAMDVVSRSDNPLSLPLNEDGSVFAVYDPLDGVRDCVERNPNLDKPVCVPEGTFLNCFEMGPDGNGTVVQIHDASGVSRYIGAVPHSESTLFVGVPRFMPLDLWRPKPDGTLPLDGSEWPVSFDSPDRLALDLDDVCFEVEARFSEALDPDRLRQHAAVIG